MKTQYAFAQLCFRYLFYGRCFHRVCTSVNASTVDEVVETKLGERRLKWCQEGCSVGAYSWWTKLDKDGNKMSITHAEDRVLSLSRDNLIGLESARYARKFETRPHISIKHVIDGLKWQYLKAGMKDIILWHKNDQFDKNGSKVFMRVVAKQARNGRQEMELAVAERGLPAGQGISPKNGRS